MNIQGRDSLSAWILAIRPATLTAAVVPVVVGTAVAARSGVAHLGAAIAALVAALLIQIGTNLVNDVDDFERGADSAARQGPTRVIQAGLLSSGQVRLAAWVAFGAAAVAGSYLCLIGGWPIMAVGVAAISSGLAYTGGPWPLGYHGLGDVFVFIFFGVVAVVGTFYVQAGYTTGLAVATSIPVGALATAILVVNNVRDSDTDRDAGKHTLAVRLGQRAGRAEFLALVALAYAVPAALWLVWRSSLLVLLPWLTLPWAVALSQRMAICRDGAGFNAALRSTARLHAAFGVLFAAGLMG
ncbi:MAG: 1,4-dihydroxy-2-naphthoate polyprenyltransferase [Candidatus Binatia bacterium]